MFTAMIIFFLQGGLEVWSDPFRDCPHSDGALHVLPVCRTVTCSQSNPGLHQGIIFICNILGVTFQDTPSLCPQCNPGFHQGAHRTSLNWNHPGLLPLSCPGSKMTNGLNLNLPCPADEEPHLQHDAVHRDPHGHPASRCCRVLWILKVAPTHFSR